MTSYIGFSHYPTSGTQLVPKSSRLPLIKSRERWPLYRVMQNKNAFLSDA